MIDIKEHLKNAICNDSIDFLKKNRDKYSIDERFEDEENDTLLLYSISYSSVVIYKYFLENGANIYLTNDLGENILHAIVYSGDKFRLQEILTGYKNIDLNYRCNDGATPLLLAISLGKFDLANELMDNGANVKIPDNNGITPLHIAVQSNDFNLVKKLIHLGADPFIKTLAGNLSLALAVNENKNMEIIKFLFNKMYKL